MTSYTFRDYCEDRVRDGTITALCSELLAGMHAPGMRGGEQGYLAHKEARPPRILHYRGASPIRKRPPP